MPSYRSFYPRAGAADKAVLTIDSVGESDMRPPPQDRLRRASWRSYQFMFTLEGAGVGEVGGAPFEAGPGDVTFMPKDREHSYIVRPGWPRWRYLWVEFGGECAERLLAMHGLAGRWHVAGCGDVAPLVDRIFAEFADRRDEALHDCVAVLISAFAIVERCARRTGAADPRAAAVALAKRRMADRLAEPLRLDDLAAHVGVSPFHLVRLFRQHGEPPPMRYLRQLRANRAKALLHRADLKIADVGRAVGYPVLQHFSRMFKQETGLTPRRFLADVVRQRPGRRGR